MNRRLLAITIFLGSFLSFALEPMIGRTLLPVFGGTPSVWVTCLAAFQVLMVGGYFYAGKVKDCRFHVPLLVASAVWCAAVAMFRKPFLLRLSGLSIPPALDVLLCVVALCGVAFILLSANSSIVQILSGGDYRLYAVSNAGSLIGLLAYPLVFEPHFALTAQWHGLGAGIVVYALLLSRAASRSPAPAAQSAPRSGSSSGVTGVRTLLYFVIPALSCALLNATTSHLTLDVAPLPLLWALLLALFLLSYIIGFSGRGHLGTWAVLAAASAVAMASFHRNDTAGFAFVGQLLSGSGVILFGCTFLHTVLYRIRPDEGGLARYYLFNVVGGAVGGVLTSIVAPLVFSSVLEFPLLIASLALAVIVWSAFAQGQAAKGLRLFAALVAVASPVLLVVRSGGSTGGRTSIYRSRGFFGTVEVFEVKAQSADGTDGALHEFVHGNTVHGIQARIPGKWRMPTCYYTKYSSGYAIAGHPKYRKGEPMRVNVTGLGVGVLFSYGRTNDYYRAYEISQDALDVALNTNLFSFVADCPAKKDVILQDARKGLEEELAAGAEPYDVIIVDAFTGDNLPYHLSSREAFELYFKLLKPDGILCVNISNWHLGLEPYIKKIGDEFDCPVLGLVAARDYAHLGFGANVVFFCRDPRGMTPPPVADGMARMTDFRLFKGMAELPTDEKGSFLSLLRF